MWEISLSVQIQAFLWSVVLGAAFCFSFDILNFIEESLKASKIVFCIFDILFFAVVGIINFCFFLAYSCGEVRGYVFFGEVLGFYICKKTAAGIYKPILLILYGVLKRIYRAVIKYIAEPMSAFFANIGIKCRKIGQKTLFFIKKVLKKPKRLVYTKEKCPKRAKRRKDD